MYLAGLGDYYGGVAVVLGVVVDHKVVHHARLFVLPLRPQGVTFDAVVEHSVRNLDFVLGAADIVAQGIDVLVCHGNHFICDEECADRNQEGNNHQRKHGTAE